MGVEVAARLFLEQIGVERLARQFLNRPDAMDVFGQGAVGRAARLAGIHEGPPRARQPDNPHQGQ